LATSTGSGTLGTGYTGAGTGGSMIIYKKAGCVELICDLNKASGGTVTYNETIFTINSGFRPKVIHQVPAIVRNTSTAGTSWALVTINTNGTIVVNNIGTSGLNQINFTVMYIVD